MLVNVDELILVKNEPSREISRLSTHDGIVLVVNANEVVRAYLKSIHYLVGIRDVPMTMSIMGAIDPLKHIWDNGDYRIVTPCPYTILLLRKCPITPKLLSIPQSV